MIIKDYKYENSTDGIHYIVDVDGCEFEMNHKRTEYGSVQHDDIEYFLDEVAEYDTQEAELIEDFVRLQNYLLIYGVGFAFKNAEEVE
jgi:gp25